MTTATGEYAHLPPQFSALSIADAGTGEELPVANNAGVAQTAPRKAWRSPPRRALAEEPRSPSWPVPSRDGAPSRKKPPPPRSPEAAAMAAPAPSSPVESAPSGDPVAPAADPREKQQMEKGTLEEKPRGSEPVAVAASRADPPPPVAASNPRTARPPLLPVPRQQQGRPPQNGRRGRVPYYQNNGDHGGNGNGGGGGHQHRRPRQHWNTVFSHQQPIQTQFVNDNFYHPMNQPMMGVPNLPPDWGFHQMPIMQWGPNPHLAHPYMGTLPPPVGPRFAEVFQYHSPTFPQYAPPPPGWSPSWFIPPPPDATLQNQPQTTVVNTLADGEDVGAKLRKQIEYYFSDENLIKDIYLKKCMDSQGWVSVHTIAEFPRIRSLTRDVGLVLGALQASDTVEIMTDKMRRKGAWNKWILPDANQEAPEG